MVRLRWRRWLLAGFCTFLFVVVYRANRSWGMGDQTIDVLREMQVYDNFAELSAEYQRHKINDDKKGIIDVRQYIRDAANQIKTDVEKLRDFLPGKNTAETSVKDIDKESVKDVDKESVKDIDKESVKDVDKESVKNIDEDVDEKSVKDSPEQHIEEEREETVNDIQEESVKDIKLEQVNDDEKKSIKDILKEQVPEIQKDLNMVRIKNKTNAENMPDDVLSMTPKTYLSNYKNPCWYEGDTRARRVRCLPFFQLIGVDKSGTTDLWFRLIQHPQVLQLNGVIGKETHWWSWRRFGFDIWVRNAKIRSYEWFLQAFDKAATTIESKTETRDNMSDYHPLVTGEGSPTVFWDFTGWDLIPQNRNLKPEDAYLTPHCIHHLTPKTKFIIIFRNPTERLYSDYLFLQQFRAKRETLSPETFNYAVIKSMKMLEECQTMHTIKSCLYNKTLHMQMPSRIMVGMYAVYLKEWLKVFPKEQILILRNEDYSKDILGHITKVYDYLDLKKLPTQELERIANLGRQFTRSDKDRSVGPMWNHTRTVLNLFYKQANQELATLLGDNNFLWNENI